jgi:hypothetical protein
MKRFVPILGAVALLLAMPTLAFAASITWTAGSDAGSDALPCTDGGHWVLSQAQAVQSATLVVGGGTYQMQSDGNDSYTADSSGPIVVGDVAVVTWDGGGQPSLALTGCTASSSPSPTPTPTPTPTPSPSGSPPPSGSPGPSGHTGGGSGQTGSGSGTSGNTPVLHGGGGTAAPVDPTTTARTPHRGARANTAIHAGPIGPLDTAHTHTHTHTTTRPSNAAVPAADGALQQAWSDGGTDPFQDARRPQRALVIAVLAVVVVGVGAAFAARRHLIHATT